MFIECEDFWWKSIGRSLAAVKAESVYKDREVVNDFIQYLLSRMDENVSMNIKYTMFKYDLWINLENGGIGVLFLGHMVDFRFG